MTSNVYVATLRAPKYIFQMLSIAEKRLSNIQTPLLDVFAFNYE